GELLAPPGMLGTNGDPSRTDGDRTRLAERVETNGHVSSLSRWSPDQPVLLVHPRLGRNKSNCCLVVVCFLTEEPVGGRKVDGDQPSSTQLRFAFALTGRQQVTGLKRSAEQPAGPSIKLIAVGFHTISPGLALFPENQSPPLAWSS